MPATRTTERLDSPQVRQFSVFLQNKVGALLEVVKLLNEHNIVALALSIQGFLRVVHRSNDRQ